MSSARRIVIVGASAAGLRCAARLARLEPSFRIEVVEEREVFSYGACGLPYVLSGDIDDAMELRRSSYGALRDTEFFAECKGVKVLAGHRAIAVDAARRTLTVESARGRSTLEWDDLVLATGARARTLPGQPDDPRIRSFHVLEDLPPLKQSLIRGEVSRVVIVGAGLVGCEVAEAFAGMWGAEVALVEAAGQPLPGMLGPELGAIAAEQLRVAGVEVHLGAPVEGFLTGEDSVGVLVAGREIRGDFVIVAVGVAPETELGRQAGAAIGAGGALRVDETLSVGVPGVWAAGDCVAVRDALTGEELHLPLGSLANRQGRTLANRLGGRGGEFPPVCAALAVKLFDWNVAAAGLNRARALEAGLDARSVWITTEASAHYWPESENVYLELVFEPASRRVLGVQAISRSDARHAIDIASQLLVRGAKLEDFAELEHAYAPVYAPAIDPLATIAFVAAAREEGIEALSPLDWDSAEGLLDVRLESERAARPIPARKARVLSFREARTGWRPEAGRCSTVVCEHGTRGAEMARLLGGAGSGVRYIGGGLSWLRAAGLVRKSANGGQA